MSISMGISGQNQFGHDTGGFLGSPNAELFTRWLEFSLFTPLFRNHSMNTSAPREPWVYGEPHTSRIRELIKWRYRLLPYLYTLFEEASRSGRPVLMPTFFYSEEDKQTYTQDTDFLLGPYLLVAPVYTEGAITRQIYLPANSSWVNYYNDKLFDGGQTINVDAPLGHPPLLVRLGAIIPQGGIGRFTDDPAFDHSLSVDIYPWGQSSFTLYEDDGNSFEYKNGKYLRTEITISQLSGQLILTLQPLDGNYQPPGEKWLFRIHLQNSKPLKVIQNDKILNEYLSETDLQSITAGWFYNSDKDLLFIKYTGRVYTQFILK